jgi:manganese/zinc/iron transport system permease protein
VLLGEIGLVWLDTVTISGIEVPVAVATLGTVLAINAAFVTLFWKELKLASFDPGLAAALGFAPVLLGHALLALTSLTAVAAFDAVGAVLFVAFVIVPPATALLLTDHLGRMLAIAALVAVVAAGAGYPLAVAFDIVIGATMACSAGVIFVVALVFAPGRGLLARFAVRREARAMSDTLALIAHLHTHEGGPEAAEENTVRALSDHLRWGGERAGRVLLRALDRGLVRRERGLILLTEKGAAEARRIFEPWARGRAAGGGRADSGAPRSFSAEP